MLPRKYKLASSEIIQIIRQGKLVNLNDVEMRYLPGQVKSKFAVIVPLRVDKRSVVRHKIKRLYFDALFALLPDLVVPILGVIRIKRCPRGISKFYTLSQTQDLLVRSGFFRSNRQ